MGERLTEFKQILITEHIPTILETGVLYISEKYGCASHLCPCGCGHEIPIPLKPIWEDGWIYCKSFNEDEKVGRNLIVSFAPSLLNKICPNNAHYFIENNKIKWC